MPAITQLTEIPEIIEVCSFNAPWETDPMLCYVGLFKVPHNIY